MSPLRIRVLRRGWPIIIPLYDARECPECCALVAGKQPQRAHEEWHRDLDAALDGDQPETEPDGYVIGHGPLPASVRGGED